MANREIKTTIKLEGEQQFRQAMKGASDAIKVLNSEEKLAAAQFEATGNKEQFMADKADILRRKIDEQQKAVNAAQEAVNKLKEQGVDPTNKAMQDWTTKLNTAKAYLTRLEGQLNTTESELEGQGDAFDDASAAAADYNDELQNIGKGIDFQNVTAIIDSMHQRLEKALEMVTSVSTAIYNAVTDAGKWADDIATEASVAGIDVETYQSWMYASQFIDTEVNTIISSRQRLLKSMTSDNKDTVKLFNDLGVVTRETNGDLRDQTDVFWDVIDALGRVEDPTMRDYYAQELLGKSARELNPLIEAGSQAYKDLAEEGRDVAVVSGENVEKLGKLNDAQNKLNSELTKLKTDTLAGIAPAFTEATEKASALVEAFNKFTETDEGKQAIENLNAAIDALFDALLDKLDPETVINVATEAIKGLTGALEWISENGWTVVAVLAGIKGIMGTITLAKGLLQALQLMKSINWLNMSKGAEQLGKTLTQGAGGGAGGSGSPIFSDSHDEAGLTRWEKLKEFFRQLPGKAAQVVPTVAAVGADVTLGAAMLSTPFVGVMAGAIGEQKQYEKNFGEAAEAVEKYAETMNAEGDERVKQMQSLLETYAGLFESDGPSGRAFFDMISKDYETLNNLLGGNSWLSADNVSTENLLERLKSGEAGDLFDWDIVGGNIVAGLTKGIEDNASTASDAAADMAQGIQDAVTDTLDINSPSVVMFEDGMNVALGLANGINARAAVAIAAAANLAAQVQAALNGAGAVSIGGYSSAIGGALYTRPSYSAYGGGAGGSAGGGVANVTLMMDKQVVGSAVAPIVNRSLGTEISMLRG